MTKKWVNYVLLNPDVVCGILKICMKELKKINKRENFKMGGEK